MADIEKFVYYNNGSKKVLKPTDRIVIGSGGLAFEGDTADDFELQLTVTDPTDDRTINFPDEDGDIALLQGDSLPKALSFPVKNPSTTTALTKGQLVYISGHSGNKPEVSLAQSNSSATMPAFGFVQSDIAAEAEGYVVYSGLFKGIDTNAEYSEGDTLYVSSTTAGEFQNTPPTGSNLIQNIGKIVKSDASNGEVLVGGAGRTNATPNLNEGKFFIGNASNQSTQSNYQLPTTLTNNAVLTSNSDSSSVALSSNLTWNNTGGADSNGLLTSQNISVTNRLSLGGSGSQFFAYNEDTVKVKFANWYSSNTRQYGQGQLWYEQWFGAIDDQAGAANRRVGFYLELPDKGASDASGGTGAHPENARMWIDVNSVGFHYDNPLRIHEDGTGEKHGTNYIQIQGQSSLASNRTLTLPDASGTFLVSDGYSMPSTLTNNAILVANSDGSSVLSTNLLTIDTSNDRIGIGTSSPARTLHLVGDVQYEGSMRIDQYHTSADGPDVLLQKARGTPATPTAVVAADELGKFVMYGHNGTSFLESAIIRSSATVDGSTYGGTLEFNTGTGGTTSNRLKIDETGTITFNNAYSFPTSDGTSGQVLQTNGSGVLTFASVSGGSTDLTNISSNVLPDGSNTRSLGSTAAEWSDLYLGDSSRIYFGNDQDVYLEHDPDAGLILDMSLDPALTPRLTIKNANTGIATGGEIEFLSETSSPAGNDIIGTITSTAKNSVSTLHEYTAVRSKIVSPTNNIESAGLYFYTATGGLFAGNASTEGLSIEGNISGHLLVDIPLHNATDSGLSLGGTLVKSTAAELNVLDTSTENPSDNDVLTYTAANGLHWTPSSVDLTSVSSNVVPSTADTYNLGSTSGEWANLYLGDSSRIYFGNDQDVTLQHIADSGLTLSMGSSQNAYDPTFTIQSNTSNTSGIGPQIKLQKMYTDPGDIVGDIYFQGYYSSVYDVYGRIKVRAPAQTHGNLQLSVLSGNVETVAIDIIGDSASSTTEIVNAGPIATKVTASDPSVRGNHAHIYSKDVSGSAEMFVQDEAGNVTQISPHNEEGDWVYWSENKKTGKKVKVNMEKMIRRLEEITGESFFEEYVEGT
jgi:hypothetical protein